jgi:hypothetical protein
MVDLALLQSVSYIAGASGVCIAAIFYVLNLRISQKNQEISQRNMRQTLETRKLQFVTSITNQLLSEEGQRRYGELLNMEWKDYDDFEKKYGSDYNLDNYAKRMNVWKTYNTLGMLVREKLIESEVLYRTNDINPCLMWSKFKDVIVEHRKRYGGVDSLSDFELLSNEILRIKLSKDPSFRIPETFSKYVPVVKHSP